MPPKSSNSKQDAAMKAASKKKESKESKRRLGYNIAIAVGVGSCILAGILALTTGQTATAPKAASQIASQMKAYQEAQEAAAAASAAERSNEPFTPKGDILRIMQGYDLNKDDKLSMDEIRSASAPKIENMSKEEGDFVAKFNGWEKAFPKADADKDGYLSAREVSDFMQQVTTKMLASKMGMGAAPDGADHEQTMALSFILLVANPKAEEQEEPQEQPKINVTKAALGAVDSVMSSLADGDEPPAEIAELQKAIEAGEPSIVGSALYLLVVKQALDFDMQNGTMVPTAVDFSNKEDNKVHEKLMFAYKYGINMAVQGYFSLDVLTDVVVNKLASRVGLDGPAFESWLGVKGFLKGGEAEKDAETKTEN